MNLSLDLSRYVTPTLTQPEWEGELELAKGAYAAVQSQKQAGGLGFAKLPYQSDEELKDLLELAGKVRVSVQAMIVVGIGGSDLGARAVQRALNHQFYNYLAEKRNGCPQLFFLGDTTDPVAISEVLDAVDLKHTAVCVISKSGNTVEQMSTFAFLRQQVLDAVGPEIAKDRIIILTDAASGTLREIVKHEGYASLPVPGDVGGRFSVLTNVGLFPLAVAGIDVKALLAGAREMDEADAAGGDSLALQYAAAQHLAYREGRNISVLMPYAYSLREVGFWFRQLWAESLGKKLDKDGREVHVGPTPIAALGPTDQHSQVQLYMEGPNDKVFTFVSLDALATNMDLPEAFPDLEGIAYLKGHSFAEILAAEVESTALALHEAGRSCIRVRLSHLDARTLGTLLYFFELATAYAGELLDVNAYDQPGVEIGKKHMYRMLGRAGF